MSCLGEKNFFADGRKNPDLFLREGKGHYSLVSYVLLLYTENGIEFRVLAVMYNCKYIYT